MERLDSESLRALFDNYITKSERKKRKKAKERVTSKGAMENNREAHHINYDCDKRHKRHEKEYAPSPKKQPPPQVPNSPQKRPASSQAGSPSKKTKNVKCKQCGLGIEVSAKAGKKEWKCPASMCRQPVKRNK